MLKLKKGQKGFTLIELMIVVAIIGILAAVAIPRFAALMRTAKEGACKGNLGAIRSAVSIYYGTYTYFPTALKGLVDQPAANKVMKILPKCVTGSADTTNTAPDGFTKADYSGEEGTTIEQGSDSFWAYWDGTTAETQGDVIVCEGGVTDTKGAYITSW